MNSEKYKKSHDYDSISCLKPLSIIRLLAIISLLISYNTALAESFGTSTDPISSVLCIIIQIISGTEGQIICVIAVCVVAGGFLSGRMQWQSAVVIIVGIVFVVKADDIVMLITGSTTPVCGGA